MEIMAPRREARPWPPRRVATTLIGVLLVGVAAIGGTTGWNAYQTHRAIDRACSPWLAPVEGLGVIAWSNGMTSSEGNWATVMANWYQHFGPTEQSRAIVAVRADGDGYAALQKDIDDDLKGPVEHVYHAITQRPAPDVLDLKGIAYADNIAAYLIDECEIAP